MQRHALARRSDHHVLGFEASIEQLLPDVHAVHRLAEAVIGDDHDVGALAQTQLVERFEYKPEMSIVIADRSERLWGARAECVLDVVGLGNPDVRNAGFQFGQHVFSQDRHRPVDRRVEVVSSAARLWLRSEALEHFLAHRLWPAHRCASVEVSVDYHTASTRRSWRHEQRAASRA